MSNLQKQRIKTNSAKNIDMGSYMTDGYSSMKSSNVQFSFNDDQQIRQMINQKKKAKPKPIVSKQAFKRDIPSYRKIGSQPEIGKDLN